MSKSKFPSSKKRNPIFNDFIPDAELDFHNFGLVDHYQVEKILTEFLEDSQIMNYKQLVVITGKGPFIRPLVKKLLGNMNLVESLKTAGYYNGQSGAYEVTLV